MATVAQLVGQIDKMEVDVKAVAGIIETLRTKIQSFHVGTVLDQATLSDLNQAVAKADADLAALVIPPTPAPQPPAQEADPTLAPPPPEDARAVP